MAEDDSSGTPERVITYTAFYKCKPDTFRLLKQADYYTLYNQNAEFVANSFLNSTEALKKNSTEPGVECWVVISQTRFPALLRFLLIEHKYSVEVYTKNGSKYLTLENNASPEYLGPFEFILYEDEVSVSLQIAAINVALNGTISFAAIDIVSCLIHLGSFKDDRSFTQLESILVRLNPKQCYVPKNFKRISDILKRNNIHSRTYTPDDQAYEAEKIVSCMLLHNYRSTFADLLQTNRTMLAPLKVLLASQNLLKEKIEDSKLNKYPFNCFFLKPLDNEHYVKLDLSSISNLNLFPSDSDNKAVQSLFQLLNHCQTASGVKMLENIIRQPLANKDLIEERLNIVEFFIDQSEVSTELRESILPRIPDITKLYRKLIGQRYTISDLYRLYLLLEQMRKMKEIFSKSHINFSQVIKQRIIFRINKILSFSDNLYVKLANAIDLKHYDEFGELILSTKMFPALHDISEKLKLSREQMKREHKSVMEKLGKSIPVTVDTAKDVGYYFRVTKQHASTIHQRPKEFFVLRVSSAKELRFLTSTLKEKINDDYLTRSRLFDEIQRDCMKALLADCENDLFKILEMEAFIAYMDVMLSFAKAAITCRRTYKKPVILPKDSSRIELIQFRHPIIEVGKDLDFVPNDIAFDDLKFYAITGANMGGKSTLIRSVALCILMAHIGSFVPCEQATVSLVDGIFSRINASDDPSQGLSTFMAEMCETSAILRSVTPYSLILIDELGRSTGTVDGFGIAQAVTEYLSDTIGSYTMFATHFHDLGLGLPRVARLNMEATIVEDSLVIQYVAKPGHSSPSFGIELMKRVGVPQKIVDAATAKLSQLLESSVADETIDQMLAYLKKDPETIGDYDKFCKSIENFLATL